MPQNSDERSTSLTTLLARAATGQDSQAWSDLWTDLYHNGSLDSSHAVVLPALADLAEGDDADTAASAVCLAGALLVQADQRYESRNLRHRYAPEVARLLAAAHRWRKATVDRNDYCCSVEVILNLEGDIHWAQDLFWGVVEGEYELECPDPGGCATVWVVMGERGWFSTVDDDAVSGDVDGDGEVEVEGATLPLRPADPDALDGLGRRLYELALSDGHEDVARALAHAFGEATCPECGEHFSVVGQVVAGAC